jgi:hypothetical protein
VIFFAGKHHSAGRERDDELDWTWELVDFISAENAPVFGLRRRRAR